MKGSTYKRQIRDGFMRILAFNQPRFGSNDSLTHSNGQAIKREGYFKDYKKFAEDNNFTEKLNLTMTNENISKFLDQRLEGLASSTQENYVRGFSSTLDALISKNITIPVSKDVFDSKVKEIKENSTDEFRTGRAVANPEQVLTILYNSHFESAVLAEIQNELGVRIAESYKIASDIDRYLTNYLTIENLVGKGNHAYSPKAISQELVEKIRLIENLPSPNTYRNHLKAVGVENSHDWRYTYAKREFFEKLENGTTYRSALNEVSSGLNHNARGSMTLRYLARV